MFATIVYFTILKQNVYSLYLRAAYYVFILQIFETERYS